MDGEDLVPRDPAVQEAGIARVNTSCRARVSFRLFDLLWGCNNIKPVRDGQKILSPSSTQMSQMSLVRVILICIQAACNHKAFTPPSPSIAKGVTRFSTDEPYLLQIAPLIAKVDIAHSLILSREALTFVLFN